MLGGVWRKLPTRSKVTETVRLELNERRCLYRKTSEGTATQTGVSERINFKHVPEVVHYRPASERVEPKRSEPRTTEATESVVADLKIDAGGDNPHASEPTRIGRIGKEQPQQ